MRGIFFSIKFHFRRKAMIKCTSMDPECHWKFPFFLWNPDVQVQAIFTLWRQWILWIRIEFFPIETFRWICLRTLALEFQCFINPIPFCLFHWYFKSSISYRSFCIWYSSKDHRIHFRFAF